MVHTMGCFFDDFLQNSPHFSHQIIARLDYDRPFRQILFYIPIPTIKLAISQNFAFNKKQAHC